MGMIDRMNNLGRTSDPDQTSESSILAAVEPEAPVIQRTRLVIDYLVNAMGKTGDAKGKRTAMMMRRIADEAIDEMSEAPADAIEFYMAEASAILYWASTGMNIENMPLPADFNIPAELDNEIAYIDRKELEA